MWRDESLVSFVLGCSFSFEEALIENGLETASQHLQQQRADVPDQHRVQAVRARSMGRWSSPCVPFKPADAIRAVQVTTRFPSVHGAPVHLGKPELIGIKDIAKPDYGDAVPVRDDEFPVFWACGVTPQSVVATVKPEFCITHAPGDTLVTDLLNSQLAIL